MQNHILNGITDVLLIELSYQTRLIIGLFRRSLNCTTRSFQTNGLRLKILMNGKVYTDEDKRFVAHNKQTVFRTNTTARLIFDIDKWKMLMNTVRVWRRVYVLKTDNEPSG